MRISDLYRKKTPPEAASPTIVDDPLFGRVAHDEDLWMARKYFGPVRGHIDIGLVAGTDGPTQAQRAFFQRIEEHYAELLGQYRSYFLTRYGPLPDGTTVEELFDSLQLQFIHLPDIMGSPTIWEMTFTSDLEGHIMLPRFTDMSFDDEGWDG
jgi:hypothetical protein